MEAMQPVAQVPQSPFSVADLLLWTGAMGAALLFAQGMIGSPAGLAQALSMLLVSGLFLLVSYATVSGRTLLSRSVAIGSFFLLLLILGVLSWHSLAWVGLGCSLSLILTRVNRSRTLHLQVLLGWLVAACLLASLLNQFLPPGPVRSLWIARAAYPIQEITPRLTGFSKVSLPAPDLAESPPQEISLYEALSPYFAEDRPKNFRTLALQRLHDQEYERFVRSLGFGAMRMSTVSRWQIDLPEITNIGFDHGEQHKEQIDFFMLRLLNDQGRYDFESEPTSLSGLLHRSYLDFLNPATLGWFAEPKKVAGFEPHAFRFPVPRVSIRNRAYSVRRLELIGLLMTDKPRVYVTDHLPRMDQIMDPERRTRDLNGFEASALQKLIAGEDLVVEEQPDQIKMVGALRSFDSCANCHDSAPRDLMGAFSYVLEPQSD